VGRDTKDAAGSTIAARFLITRPPFAHASLRLRQFRELFQGIPVARSPTTHRVLPRLQKGLCSPFTAACRLPLGKSLAAQLLSYGAGERKQVVISSGIGMQPRQEQSPRVPIFEGPGPTGAPYFSHWKGLPSFPSILRPLGKRCKARCRTTTTPGGARPTPRPHTALRYTRGSRRNTSSVYPESRHVLWIER
jgi:hypothetical protein